MRKPNDFCMCEILVALCLNDGRYRPYRLFFPEFPPTSPGKLLLTKGSITQFLPSGRLTSILAPIAILWTFNLQLQKFSNISANVSLENFTTVAVNITVSWYVTPCSLVHRYRRSALTCYLIHQGMINSSMKWKAASCSETLVSLIQTTRPYIKKRVVSINAAARFSFPREKS
jgi:hypothetical protein